MPHSSRTRSRRPRPGSLSSPFGPLIVAALGLTFGCAASAALRPVTPSGEPLSAAAIGEAVDPGPVASLSESVSGMDAISFAGARERLDTLRADGDFEGSTTELIVLTLYAESEALTECDPRCLTRLLALYGALDDAHRAGLSRAADQIGADEEMAGRLGAATARASELEARFAARLLRHPDASVRQRARAAEIAGDRVRDEQHDRALARSIYETALGWLGDAPFPSLHADLAWECAVAGDLACAHRETEHIEGISRRWRRQIERGIAAAETLARVRDETNLEAGLARVGASIELHQVDDARAEAERLTVAYPDDARPRTQLARIVAARLALDEMLDPERVGELREALALADGLSHRDRAYYELSFYAWLSMRLSELGRGEPLDPEARERAMGELQSFAEEIRAFDEATATILTIYGTWLLRWDSDPSGALLAEVVVEARERFPDDPNLFYLSMVTTARAEPEVARRALALPTPGADAVRAWASYAYAAWRDDPSFLRVDGADEELRALMLALRARHGDVGWLAVRRALDPLAADAPEPERVRLENNLAVALHHAGQTRRARALWTHHGSPAAALNTLLSIPEAARGQTWIGEASRIRALAASLRLAIVQCRLGQALERLDAAEPSDVEASCRSERGEPIGRTGVDLRFSIGMGVRYSVLDGLVMEPSSSGREAWLFLTGDPPPRVQAHQAELARAD